MKKRAFSLPGITVFNQFTREYDYWFDENGLAYLSEVEAIRRVIPEAGTGIEIGAGTGRFSIPFGIKIGIEPAENMAKIAQSRGIQIVRAVGEELPFKDKSIDYILMVTVICFLSNIPGAIREVWRVLKPRGRIIIGFIDKESNLGRKYETMKESNRFYKWATFYSANQIIEVLTTVGFSGFKFYQTIFTNPKDMVRCDPVQEGHGKGSFIVLSAIKV